MKKIIMIAVAFAVIGTNIQVGIAATNAAGIFKKKCAMCHALNRKRFGPAFSKMNKNADILRTTIKNGRKNMPSFDKKLSNDEIDTMVAFIQSNKAK